MLLSEITNFPPNHDSKFTDVLNQFIEKHGVEAFHGGQAVVIDKKTYVWRVWFNDPGYERFLEYIKSNQSNKYLPKILSKVRVEPTQFKGMPKGLTIKYVKIEKLKEAEPSNFTDAIDALYSAFLKPNKFPNTIDELSNLSMTLKSPNDSDAINNDIKEEILKNKEFFEIILDLMKHHKANDLTSGNVMFRGNIPVITDPFKD